MERIVVVGSGASGVHFALALLERGIPVTMLDVGRPRPQPVRLDDTFAGLKGNLDDPAAYFLGDRFQGVTWPGAGEYYGFPPHKEYIFAGIDPFRHRSRGFAPLVSFAQGGLAEAWTAGTFPYSRDDAEAAGFDHAELLRHYGRVAARIGVSGQVDDLSPYLPVHENLQEPLRLDEHSRRLLDAYASRRAHVNRRLRAYIGRSRVATLSAGLRDRPACTYTGRCLTGCATDALYTPAITLRECLAHDGFTYRSGVHVSHFKLDGGRRITHVVASPVDAGTTTEEIPVDRLVLAAGTLCTGRIVLESVRRATGELATLNGLMDNRQMLMPFVNTRMVRRPYDPDSYQYHQILIGALGDTPRDYLHGIVTTLKTASIHPIVQNVPLDMRTSLHLFRHVHAALGLININRHDDRREGNGLTLELDGAGRPRLLVHYAPPAGEDRMLKKVRRRFRRVLRALGCFAPPGMTHVRPMGSSVHYAGTLPMTATAAPFTTTPDCRSHDFANLWVVDGSVLPFLPAKNFTFTLMANAGRVAETLIG